MLRFFKTKTLMHLLLLMILSRCSIQVAFQNMAEVDVLVVNVLVVNILEVDVLVVAMLVVDFLVVDVLLE